MQMDTRRRHTSRALNEVVRLYASLVIDVLSAGLANGERLLRAPFIATPGAGAIDIFVRMSFLSDHRVGQWLAEFAHRRIRAN